MFSPKAVPVEELGAGEVGFSSPPSRSQDAKIGDTVTEAGRPAPNRCPGFKGQADGVRRHLSDEGRDTRAARRAGEAAAERRLVPLRAGDLDGAWLRISLRFLGLLHMEIVQERLEREFDMDL